MKSVLLVLALSVPALTATACYQPSTDGDHCNLSCFDSVCPSGLQCNEQK